MRSQGDPAGFPASARAIPRTNGPIVSIVLTPRCKEYLFRSTLDLPNNGEAGRFWTHGGRHAAMPYEAVAAFTANRRNRTSSALVGTVLSVVR